MSLFGTGSSISISITDSRLHRAHPYEEPAYHVIKLEDF